YLGHTLGAIAREKAGILRKGRPAVLGPLPVEARTAIGDEGRTRGARIVDAFQGVSLDERAEGVRVTTPTATYGEIRPLPGAHQRDNLVVAIRILEEARAAGLPVNLGSVAAGLSKTEWPGRLQWIPGD